MIAQGLRWLVGGVVLGQVAPKVLTSDKARECYVKGIAAGMRAKAAYQDFVEQARAEIGDMVAEATLINAQDAADVDPLATEQPSTQTDE